MVGERPGSRGGLQRRKERRILGVVGNIGFAARLRGCRRLLAVRIRGFLGGAKACGLNHQIAKFGIALEEALSLPEGIFLKVLSEHNSEKIHKVFSTDSMCNYIEHLIMEMIIARNLLLAPAGWRDPRGGSGSGWEGVWGERGAGKG